MELSLLNELLQWNNSQKRFVLKQKLREKLKQTRKLQESQKNKLNKIYEQAEGSGQFVISSVELNEPKNHLQS